MNSIRQEVLAALDTVLDPCSVSFGVPLSLCDMGLVTGVDLAKDGKVAVRLRLTTPGCLEGVVKFSHEIQTKVGSLPGVRSVSVDFDDSWTWSEADISPDGQRRLREGRAARRLSLEVEDRPASAGQRAPDST